MHLFHYIFILLKEIVKVQQACKILVTYSTYVHLLDYAELHCTLHHTTVVLLGQNMICNMCASKITLLQQCIMITVC